MRISRSVMAVGGVVVAAAAIGFTNPKAVHAVAAALVQVTNTASDPVVTQSVGQQAAQIVSLYCVPNANPVTGSCSLITDTYQGNPAYVVPANESLVVTAVDIYTYILVHEVALGYTACSAGREDGIALSNGGPYRLTWEMVDNTSPTHFTYPSGVVFGPGSTPSPSSRHYNASLDAQCGSDAFLVYGYLTPS
ncbi:MAG TPA: hypothetical protein VGM11_05045 [Acidobacteriaceae bacterium]|jgi:hypothetical protein